MDQEREREIDRERKREKVRESRECDARVGVHYVRDRAKLLDV